MSPTEGRHTGDGTVWVTGAQVRTLAAAHRNGGRIDVPPRQQSVARRLIAIRAVELYGITSGGGFQLRLLGQHGAQMAAWASEHLDAYLARKEARAEGGRPRTMKWAAGARGCPQCFCSPSSPCSIAWDEGQSVGACAPAGVVGLERCSGCELAGVPGFIVRPHGAAEPLKATAERRSR